jgi:hypothetical protein
MHPSLANYAGIYFQTMIVQMICTTKKEWALIQMIEIWQEHQYYKNKCPSCHKIVKGSSSIQDMLTIQRACEKH